MPPTSDHDGVRVVAIDGPAGAGKSTVGRALARRLGLDYLDTGAMYRGVTFAVLRRGLDPDDPEAVARVARDAVVTVDDTRVLVDGVDATVEIRGPAVTSAVSAVAANPAVRAELRRQQREWALARGGGVIEGRDIGSVVFPDAMLKVYLTASPRVRAERRVAELGGDADHIERMLAERDRRDSTRDDSPLTMADGAITIDTTGLEVDEVVERLLGLIEAGEASQP